MPKGFAKDQVLSVDSEIAWRHGQKACAVLAPWVLFVRSSGSIVVESYENRKARGPERVGRSWRV